MVMNHLLGSDLRSTSPGDVWVGGVICWGRVGYTFGIPVLNSCLNISDAGTITAEYENNNSFTS